MEPDRGEAPAAQVVQQCPEPQLVLDAQDRDGGRRAGEVGAGERVLDRGVDGLRGPGSRWEVLADRDVQQLGLGHHAPTLPRGGRLGTRAGASTSPHSWRGHHSTR